MRLILRGLVAAAVMSGTVAGCSHFRFVSKDQGRSIRSESRTLRRAIPAIHNAIRASTSSGALIVFESDGSLSSPYLADSAESAAALRLDDRSAEPGSALSAVFVFGPDIAKYPTWYLLDELEGKVLEKRAVDASVQELRDASAGLAAEVAEASASIVDLEKLVSRLETFGIEMTRLGLVQQALLDGHQDELTAIRKSISSLLDASKASAKTNTETQGLLGDALKSISDRIAAIEVQVKRL